MNAAVRRVVPLAALAFIGVIDVALKRIEAPLVPTGLLDETAHVLTGLLCFGALVPWLRGEWVVGVAIGSTFIDMDHIPLTLGWDYYSRGTVRPYSHSLLTICIVVGIIPILRLFPREVCWSVGLGLATHLLRDMATGGVPFFWPVTKATETVPYQVYASLLIAAALLCTTREWERIFSSGQSAETRIRSASLARE